MGTLTCDSRLMIQLVLLYVFRHLSAIGCMNAEKESLKRDLLKR